MEITVCGMTLEEVEENFRNFKKMREDKETDYNRAKLRNPRIPRPATFFPDEEFAFVHKINDEIQKIYNDLNTAEMLALAIIGIDSATEEEKDQYETLDRVELIRVACGYVIDTEKEIEKKKHSE